MNPASHQHLYSNFPPPPSGVALGQQQQSESQSSGSSSSPARAVPSEYGHARDHHQHHSHGQLHEAKQLHHHHQQQHKTPHHPQQQQKYFHLGYDQQSSEADADLLRHRPHMKQEREREATQSTPSDGAQGRAYRSRKDRPCDTCRKRKSRCIIEEAGQDCQSCRLNGRSCTFEISPTPRSRPIRNEDGVTISSVIVPRKRSHSKEQSDPSRSPSTGLTLSNNAGASGHEQGASQKRAMVLTDGPPLSYKMQSNVTLPARPPPPSTISTMVHTSFLSASSNMDASDASPSGERRQSTASAAAAEMRRYEDACKSSEKARSDQLYGLLSEVMHGEGHAANDSSPASSHLNEENDDQHSDYQPPQEEKAGMMPVVLGSSSSEDPHLLRQAGSPPSRHAVSSPSNDHMSSSSKTFGGGHNNNNMPPPPTPDTQGSSGPQHNVLGPLQVRQVTNDPHRPIFFAFVPSNPYGRSKGKGREVGSHGLTKLTNALQGRIGPLMILYSQRDATAFPLLTESQRRKFREAAVEAMSRDVIPTIPLPAVLATATLATPTVYDVSLRPISKQAWGANLHALMEQFEISTIVTLQVALTDLTGRPSINTSGNFMTFNQTLAISHMLGLHLDPTSWNLPREEKDVRIRLWWATVIHDKWSSLCWGRPSTIHRQDFSVPLPRRNSLSPCQEHLEDKDLRTFSFGTGWTARAGAHTPGDTFAGLCRLTLILGDILDEFHSVRALHILHRDAFGVAQRIKSYFVAIEDWLDALPETLKCVLRSDNEGADGTGSIPGTRSLQLSYLGVNLLLCRTALDAVTTKGTQDGRRLVPAHKTALHATLMVVEFLESLTADDFGGFFLHYGSHHLASCLSLLARLCFGFARMDEKVLLETCIGTLQRLLVVLSESHRLYKWDLAELALTRSRAILPALETRIDEFPKFFPAVYWHGRQQPTESSPSPFVETDPERSTDARAEDNDRAQNPSDLERAPQGEGGESAAQSGRDNAAAAALQSIGLNNNAHKDSSDQLRRSFTPLRTAHQSQSAAPDGRHSASRQAGSSFTPHAQHHSSLEQHDSGTLFRGGSGGGGAGHPSHLFDFHANADGGSTTVSIPLDAVGLPYPLGLNNAETLSYLSDSVGLGVPTALGSGTSGASHLLSSMEVDWLGMGLQPDTYPDYFAAGPTAHPAHP